MGKPAVCCMLLLALMGCSTPGGIQLTPPDIRNMNSQVTSLKRQTLSSGDTLSIHFLYSPELNNDAATIGLDGKISLQLVGAVQAAGLTLAELDMVLTEKYYKALGYSFGTYTLGVGDTIAIELLYNSELNSEVKVRPDKKISLPLIGEMLVAGMTPGELEELLIEKYAQKLDTEETPEVTVIVREFKVPELNVTLVDSASQMVYVTGEVFQPRMVNVTGPMKVLNAITMAGGTNNDAALDSVVLIRYSETDKATAYILDMKDVLAGEMPDLTLQPYDIIYVPETSLAKADNFMSRIWRMLPTSVLFSFPYDLNTDSEVTVINQ